MRRLAVAAAAVILAGSSALALPPSADAIFALKPVKIDGKLDDVAWKEATPLRLTFTGLGEEIADAGTAKLAWDRDYLYVAFDIPDDHVQSNAVDRDSTEVESGDHVGLLVHPSFSGPGYARICVSAAGALSDRYEEPRTPDNPRYLRLANWSPAVRSTIRITPRRSASALRSGSKAPGGRYSVELAIPLTALTEVTFTGNPQGSYPSVLVVQLFCSDGSRSIRWARWGQDPQAPYTEGSGFVTFREHPTTFRLVTLSLKNAKPGEALDLVFKDRGLQYSRSPWLDEHSPRLNLEMKDVPFREALGRITEAAGGRWSLMDGIYVFRPLDPEAEVHVHGAEPAE